MKIFRSKFLPLQIQEKDKKSFRFVTGDGIQLSGGRLYAYKSGTMNQAELFADDGGTIKQTFPVILDAKGEANIFIRNGEFPDLVITDTTGVIQYRSYDSER